MLIKFDIRRYEYFNVSVIFYIKVNQFPGVIVFYFY